MALLPATKSACYKCTIAYSKSLSEQIFAPCTIAYFRGLRTWEISKDRYLARVTHTNLINPEYRYSPSHCPIISLVSRVSGLRASGLERVEHEPSTAFRNSSLRRIRGCVPRMETEQATILSRTREARRLQWWIIRARSIVVDYDCPRMPRSLSFFWTNTETRIHQMAASPT